MSILVICWRCESYVRAPVILADSPVKCVTCGATVHLPKWPPAPASPPTFWESRGRPAFMALAILLYGILASFAVVRHMIEARREELRAPEAPGWTARPAPRIRVGPTAPPRMLTKSRSSPSAP